MSSVGVSSLATSEVPEWSPAGWCTTDLGERRASSVGAATSDAHAGFISAISATLPGATWQRYRTHYAANLMSATPKSSWDWAKALLHSIYDQPDADAVHAQFDRVIDAFAEKLPTVADYLEEARADILARAQGVDTTHVEELAGPELQALTT